MEKERKAIVILQNSLRTVPIFRDNYIKILLKTSNVIVIAPNDCVKSKSYLQKIGVKVISVPPIRGKLSLIQYLFISNLCVLKFRLLGCHIICHFVSTFIFNFFSLIPFNRKVVIYIEGLGSVFTRSKALKNVLKFMLSMNRGVTLFCNTTEKSQVGNSSSIVTNGIGVDLDKYKLKQLNLTRLSERKFRLLFVGRLIQDKGVLDAIAVFQGLKLLYVDVSLTLVGDVYPNNPSSISHEQIDVLKSKYGDDISFVGFSESIIDWYNYADILLLPSIREGFPVCVMEASAVGVPCFGYDVPGVRDAIIYGVNGYTVEYGNIKGLIKLVSENLSTNNLVNLSRTSNQHALLNFDIIDKSNQVISKLKSL